MTILSPDKRLIDTFARKLAALHPVRYHACLSIGLSASLWSRVVSGKISLSVRTAGFLLKAFKITRDEYLDIVGLGNGPPCENELRSLVEIGELIRQVRLVRGLSLQKVAEQVDLTRVTLRKNEIKLITRTHILWLIRLDELFETNISWAACLSAPGKGSGENGKHSRSLYR